MVIRSRDCNDVWRCFILEEVINLLQGIRAVEDNPIDAAQILAFRPLCSNAAKRVQRSGTVEQVHQRNQGAVQLFFYPVVDIEDPRIYEFILDENVELKSVQLVGDATAEQVMEVAAPVQVDDLYRVALAFKEGYQLTVIQVSAALLIDVTGYEQADVHKG